MLFSMSWHYCKELCDAICSARAMGLTMRQIDDHPSLPSKDTIYRWLDDDAKADFREQFARASDQGIDALVDEMIAISDDAINDTLPDGRIDHEHVQRSKLRVDTRKWVASKRAPKKYGDRIDVTSSDGSMTPARGLNDFYDDDAAGDDSQTAT